VFDMLQRAGFDCYIFRGPFSGLPAVALHGFYVVVSVLLLSMIAKTLRDHALAAQESSQLISYLDKEKGINLRIRAQLTLQEKFPPWARYSTTTLTT